MALMEVLTRYFDDPIVPQRAIDILLPERIRHDVAVVAVHGGGWAAGTRSQLHQLLEGLVNEGFACASLGYRLATGSGSLDRKMEDIRLGYDHFRRHLAEKGIRKVKRFATYGSSAGAHLSGLMALSPPGTHGDDIAPLQMKWLQPCAAIMSCGPVTFIPWKDIFPESLHCFERLIGCTYEQDRAAWTNASLDAHVSPDSKTTPEMMLICAGDEHMFPNWLTRRTVARWKKARVRATIKTYTNCEHGFLYDDGPRRQQREAFADMVRFLKKL